MKAGNDKLVARLWPSYKRTLLPFLAIAFLLAINQLRLSHHYFVKQSRSLRGESELYAPVTRKLSHIARPQQESPSFIVDDLCGKCRYASIQGRRQPCGAFIYRHAFQKKVSLVKAARFLVEEDGLTECRSCLPELCEEHAQKLWRYDRKAPPILHARVHYLSTIPSVHRIPSNDLPALHNNYSFEPITQILSDPRNSYPTREYLFEYNPSIIQIPPNQIPEIQGERPVYLASYRVSTQQSCFPDNTTLALIGGSWVRKPRTKDYLGLALLRADLSIVQDVVLDLHKPFSKREDFRLFVIHDQIYVASFCQIAPLWIGAKLEEDTGISLVPQVFPSPLQISMRVQPTFCSQKTDDLRNSKSLNYFVDQDNQTVVEMQPMGPHVIHAIDLSSTELEEAPSEENVTMEETMPEPSFYTMEEADLANKQNFFNYPFTQERGGACCTPFTDPANSSNPLLLGVSHVKTPHGRKILEGVVQGNHYLSRVYAFEARAPYRVVARSGFFCLPAQPPNHSEGGKINPLAKLPIHNPLDITGLRYEQSCAAIHFVTGMTEKIDDPTKLIIAYGVSDCTSWFIQVEKAHVISMLYPQGGIQ